MQQPEASDFALDSKDQSDAESKTDAVFGNEKIEKSSNTQERQQPAYEFPEGGSKAWITVVGVVSHLMGKRVNRPRGCHMEVHPVYGSLLVSETC